MIIDAFTYFNEEMMLELRIQEHWEYVDIFLIVEGDRTFRGDPKPFNFKMRPEWEKKVCYLSCTLPESGSPWDREGAQRLALWNFMRDKVAPHDLIILSDVDEIINFSSMPEDINTIHCLEMSNYNYFFNLKVREVWTLPKIGPADYMLAYHPDRVRRQGLATGYVRNAGWHFSNVMTAENFILKHRSFAHSECDKPELLTVENVERHMQNMTSVFGDKQYFKPEKVGIETMPETIKNNEEKYAQFLLR